MCVSWYAVSVRAHEKRQGPKLIYVTLWTQHILTENTTHVHMMTNRLMHFKEISTVYCGRYPQQAS